MTRTPDLTAGRNDRCPSGSGKKFSRDLRATPGGATLDLSDFPSRHPYVLGLWRKHIERIMAEWVGKLGVPIRAVFTERELTIPLTT